MVENGGDNSQLTGSLPPRVGWGGGGWSEETDYDDAGQRWPGYIMFLISHKRLKAVRFLDDVKPAVLPYQHRLPFNLRDHQRLLLWSDSCSKL